MGVKRKINVAKFQIIIIALLFSFGALIGYRYTVNLEKNELEDEILKVKNKIEYLISARIINANGMAGFIELNKSIDQRVYDVFAREIYNSEKEIVKDVVFITDTTITYIYPEYLGSGAIGVDLALIPEQKDNLLYTKEHFKTVYFGPIDLVEGGRGIIVRVPVVVNRVYYGQVAIVFDYIRFIKESGLKDIAVENYVALEGTDPASGEKMNVWSSDGTRPKDVISQDVILDDINWVITAAPVSGWHGFSVLFYLIILVGALVVIGATVAYRKESDLRTEIELANIGLKKTVDQLAENEKKLIIKYDEVKEKESYIQQLADYDELTGLHNRRLFREHLEKSISQGDEGIIALVDIDDFKNINDIHGHVYGDQVLKAFSKVIEEVVDDRGTCYRFGGDEFLVLFEGAYEDGYIMKFSKLIQEALHTRLSELIPNHITLSAGVVRYPAQGVDVKSLLIRADVAMYESKASGKNQIKIFRESMLMALDKKIAIEKHIRKALKNNGFEMNYQPIVDANTEEIVSFEALIRLKDRAYSPMVFIEVAESSGGIIELGEWILEEVFSTIQSWIEGGKELKPVAINLSPNQLLEPSFREKFFRLVEKYKVPSHLIEVEITENILLENEEGNLNVLRSLRSAGIKVSLDDFGTGYSSFKYLTYLPIDKVKIDKSLKDHLVKMDNDKILTGIIMMVHGLGLKVVAEGIETKDEVDVLKRLGCDQIQGYYFSRPLAVDKVDKLF